MFKKSLPLLSYVVSIKITQSTEVCCQQKNEREAIKNQEKKYVVDVVVVNYYYDNFQIYEIYEFSIKIIKNYSCHLCHYLRISFLSCQDSPKMARSYYRYKREEKQAISISSSLDKTSDCHKKAGAGCLCRQ